MNAIIPRSPVPDYDWAVDKVLDALKLSSRRVYASSFTAYGNWCEVNQIEPLPLSIDHVKQFIIDQPVTMNSRKRMMSAIRKLAWFMALDFNNPINKAVYEYLKAMPVPEAGAGGKPRDKEALTEREIDRVMNTWKGDDPIEVRNHALIRVLLAFGGRRSETVALRWTDIDLSKGIVRIQHGKGDKYREVPILGNKAINALRYWMRIQGAEQTDSGEYEPTYEYVFTPMSTNGLRVQEDKPMSADTLYLVVQKTEDETKVKLHPHKFRGTGITVLLENGNSLADVRDWAGHANGGTTMGYAVKANAMNLKKRLKAGWE